MTLKVIENQWYWSYKYFDSYMKSEEDLTLGNF